MIRLLRGDCRETLVELEPGSVQSCITSPPYWGLRDYGTAPLVWGGDPDHEHTWSTSLRPGQSGGYTTKQSCVCGASQTSLGLEPSPELYVEHLVECFRAVRRVLRDDGTLWVNLGDSYAGSGKGPSNSIQGDAAQIGPSARKARGLNNLESTPTAWIPINGSSVGSRIGSQNGDSGHTSGVTPPRGYKAKDLIGIPWMVAFALRADGWWPCS